MLLPISVDIAGLVMNDPVDVDVDVDVYDGDPYQRHALPVEDG